MLATHIPKLVDARVKTGGICSSIIGEVPAGLICSDTVNPRKPFWAAPKNARDMGKWRGVSVIGEIDRVLPDEIDGHLSQVFLPMDWQQDGYIVGNPIPHAGVLHELYCRLGEQRLPYFEWILEPNAVARSNHGEVLLDQKGAIRMLRRGPARIEQGSWTGSYLQVTARCQNMNLSSGLMAVGFPALTAVGGFVHVLERATGQDIQFAFGVQSSEWQFGVPKMATHSAGEDRFTLGRTRHKTIHVHPGYDLSQVSGHCDVVILLQSERLEGLIDALSGMTRLAGGSLLAMNIVLVENELPPVSSYLIDASADVVRVANHPGFDDYLQAALDLYGLEGEWRDGEWWQPRNGYTLSHSGYALLEQPVKRAGVRASYDHAWVEPVFSLITQGSMSRSAWWQRVSNDAGVFWRGADLV